MFVALTGLGFRQREAQRMIDTVRARANIGYDIDAVMKAALEEAPLSCVRGARSAPLPAGSLTRSLGRGA